MKNQMPKSKTETGYSRNGLPYARTGCGPRLLVIFDGLDFTHKPPSWMERWLFTGFIKRLGGEYSVYQVRRRPGLPQGYTMRDMAADYAVMIKDELGGPVDVMGVSTGGPMAQHFAVDYPGLTRRLVLAMTGPRLSQTGKKLQRDMAAFIRAGRWAQAGMAMSGALFSGVGGWLFRLWCRVMGRSVFGSPKDPSDGLIEIEAEDRHDFRDRLKDIKVPTLVIGGDKDYFYDVSETAPGITDVRTIIYPGVGHTAVFQPHFAEDVAAFLAGNTRHAGK
jgi:pimeloyl-ACP methyl ester carboxylesterase